MTAAMVRRAEVGTGRPSRWRPTPREFDCPKSLRPLQLAATMCRYLDQIARSLPPSSVTASDGIPRRFAGYLVLAHPEVGGVADIERRHIEAFKRYLPR